MRAPYILAIASFGFMAACSDTGAQYIPILDGAPEPGFEADLAECQSLARGQKQFDQETAAATSVGAVAGAIFGAGESGDPWGGALAGSLFGGLSVAIDNHERRQKIVIECMRGRDHAVVG